MTHRGLLTYEEAEQELAKVRGEIAVLEGRAVELADEEIRAYLEKLEKQQQKRRKQ